MGLIARALEAAGIPTLSMSSARDITRAAWPARSVYLDFPLGHTSGRPHQPELNLQVMRETLDAFETLSVPGSMAHLDHRWSDTDNWKDKAFMPVESAETDGSDEKTAASGGSYDDDRVARYDTPQYQTEEDAAAAHAEHEGQDCLVCAGIDY